MVEHTSKDTRTSTKAGQFHVNLSLLVYKALYFTFWGSIGCFFPYVSLYFKQLGFSPASIGLINALRPVCGCLLPFIAAAADRFRCRKLVLVASIVLSTGIFFSLVMVPPASEVPCDVMEGQIREFLNRNISLPYQGNQPSVLLQTDIVVSADSVVGIWKRRSHPKIPVLNFPAKILAYDERGAFKRSAQTSDNYNIGRSNQIPRRIREILMANQSWMYDQADLGRLFLIVLAISSFIELVVFTSGCQIDIAVLDALQREHGDTDQYGWNRGFGTLGWGACSLAVGWLLSSTRSVELTCGIEHIISGYWAAFLVAIGINVVSLFCAFYFVPSMYVDKKDAREESSWGPIKTVLLSWHYGSVVIMLTFLGLCNGCIWGFLFWHFENLGATQGLLGVLIGIESLSEFVSGLFSAWSISKFGHIALLSLGLFLYIVRFIAYALIVVPWIAIFIEIIHGLCFIMTWTTAVSYLNKAIPLQCGGTMQGILISTHHGLGAGLGFFVTGLLINSYGAPGTFLLYASLCGIFLIIFLLIQWLSKVPPSPWKCEGKTVRSVQEDGETDEVDTRPTKTLIDSPVEKNGKLSLKLPAFTYQTKAINQQEPW